MAVLQTMLRQDGLKVAESRVRALTREVGSLKEDLRREVKRREKALVAAREAEEVRVECEKRVKQLEYSKRKLEQESFTAQQQAQHNTAKSRAATTSLREEIAAKDTFAAEQAAASHHQLRHMSRSLERLQALLLQPDAFSDSPLSSKAVPAVQSGFAELMQCLSQLSSTVSAAAPCQALTAPGHCAHAELERLRTEIALLKAQQQATADASQAQQTAAADMGALIPEYRTTLGRMKTQVDNLHQRLEDACEENNALQEQVTLLRKACSSPAAQASKRVTPCKAAQVSEDDEDAKKLIRDIRSLKKRCRLLETETDAVSVTNSELQTVVADRDDQLERQRQVIANLEATIHDQSSDIRTALQLVTSSQGSRAGSKMSEQQDDIAAAMQLCNQPNVDRTRQHCSSLRNSPRQHVRKDASWTESLMQQSRSSAVNQPHFNRKGYRNEMHMLCRDMQHLDAELADLDAGLISASHGGYW